MDVVVSSEVLTMHLSVQLKYLPYTVEQKLVVLDATILAMYVRLIEICKQYMWSKIQWQHKKLLSMKQHYPNKITDCNNYCNYNKNNVININVSNLLNSLILTWENGILQHPQLCMAKHTFCQIESLRILNLHQYNPFQQSLT